MGMAECASGYICETGERRSVIMADQGDKKKAEMKGCRGNVIRENDGCPLLYALRLRCVTISVRSSQPGRSVQDSKRDGMRRAVNKMGI